MPNITPFLWFVALLEEPIAYYRSIFPDMRVHSQSSGSAEFEIAGQGLMALNGGPEVTFSEAVSFFIECEGQEEVDYYWDG